MTPHIQQQNQSRQCIFVCFFFITSAALIGLVCTHPQFRQLKCATLDGQLRAGPDTAHCHLILKDVEEESPGRPAPEGDGCFTVCPKAHTVFHAAIDQGHRACFNYYTYQLEKRQDEWFLWRSEKCLNSTVTFTVGCKFDEPFRTQFATDDEVFAKLRARTAARKLLLI